MYIYIYIYIYIHTADRASWWCIVQSSAHHASYTMCYGPCAMYRSRIQMRNLLGRLKLGWLEIHKFNYPNIA